jgi:hypothetical protein
MNSSPGLTVCSMQAAYAKVLSALGAGEYPSGKFDSHKCQLEANRGVGFPENRLNFRNES